MAPTVAGVKFCNSLTISDGEDEQIATLMVDIGGVQLTADSYQCAPANGCAAIDPADDVQVTISDGEGNVFNTTTIASVWAGDEIVISTDLDAASMPLATYGYGTGICSGGDGTEGTVAKFCNFLVYEGGTSFVATLDVGGTTIEAASGTCAPIAACTGIPSGDVSVELLDDQGTSMAWYSSWNVESGVEMLFVATRGLVPVRDENGEVVLDEEGQPMEEEGNVVDGSPSSGVCSASEARLRTLATAPTGSGWKKGSAGTPIGFTSTSGAYESIDP